MSTRNRVDFQTLGSKPVMPINFSPITVVEYEFVDHLVLIAYLHILAKPTLKVIFTSRPRSLVTRTVSVVGYYAYFN